LGAEMAKQDLQTELEKKTRELIDVKAEKKKIVGSYNDTIKSLDERIEEIILELNGVSQGAA
jgi:F0F1-type ATP synthase membrane subunit b/b'